MKNITKKYLSKIDFNLLKISAILVVLFYGINFSIEYATDTYSTFMETDTWKWMLYENGRLFNAVIYYLIETLQISNGYVYKLSYILALFCLISATYILARLLHEFCNSKFLCSAVSFLTLSNFFIIEYFLFIEKGLFMLAILLCTLAAYFTVQFFKGKKKLFLFLFLTFVLLLWAVFIYQIMLALYVILCLPFILKYSTDFKNFIMNNIIVACSYALPLLLAFLILKFSLGSSRMGSIGNIFVNLYNLIPTIISISTEQWFHLPKYTLSVCLLIALTMCIISIFKNSKQPNIINAFISLTYVIAGTIFTAFFPFISGLYSGYVPRTIYPYGCIYGIIFIIMLIMYPPDFKINISPIVTQAVLLILIIQYFNFENILIEKYKVNQIDKYYSEIIGNKIKEYEADTNVTIDTICFYNDMATTWYDHGCEDSHLIPRAQSCGWSNLNAINLYLESNYIKGTPLPQYENHFNQYNWDTYSDKQIIFEGNTLHICIY